MERGKSDDLVAELRRRISAGDWSESGRLPTERVLAEQFGVARNTVRRAFERLERDGVVTRHVGRGTYLREPTRTPLVQIVERIEGASPADMMELRLLIEPAAAAFAATNASADQLATIGEAHERALAAPGMEEFESWDTELHQQVLSCSRNDLLREINNILTLLRHQPRWFELKARSFSETRRQAYCAEHERLVRALLRRHPEEARAAMHAHLLSVQANLIGR